MARKRYLCPKHKETTPSAVVYHDAWFCFGCGSRGPISELGMEVGERAEPEYVEDLAATINYVKRLPRRDVRGFQLHANDRGYYLLWPDDTYYKYRSFSVDTPGGKYRGPSGHSKPWFVAQSTPEAKVIVLVEGEFNALSLAALEPRIAIVSPGGTGDFYSRGAQKNLEDAARYEKVVLVVDSDAAGARAAIEAKSKLLVMGCRNVQVALVEKDFNDVLVQEGKDALKQTATRLGLF